MKVASIRALGAEIVTYGSDYDGAREHCEQLADEKGFRYVHSGNEPHLIAGVATETLEIIEDIPEIEVLIVPVGGGSGAAGACIVAKAVRQDIEVIAVQSSEAPTAYRSWLKGSLSQLTTTRSPKALLLEPPSSVRNEYLGNILMTSFSSVTKKFDSRWP